MTSPSDTTQPQGNPARKKALTAVAAVVVAAGLGYGAYWALVLNHFETTDNAYVQGNLVQVTPQVAGTVVAINANDNDRVKAGQWLVRLDPTDAKIALEQAEAQLAQTVREVRTLYANNRTQTAQIALREADLARVQSDLVRLQDDVNRRQPLVASGAVGQEEFKHATAQLAAAKSSAEAARAGVSAAREQLASNQSLTEGITVDQNPNVLRAAARVREAYVSLKRVELQAPVEGYVARRNVQLGQRLQAGAPLLSVIALDQVWVDANFKESQLKNLRIGQPVDLTADVYGSKVVYHGVIEGLGAGTGAAFALLPAQNATGNWIKVVQRVPVRVRLDAKELVDHPLRLGLSMEARVDVSKTDGRMLADAAAAPVSVQTEVFEQDNREADARVQQLIAQHGGVARAVVSQSKASKAGAPSVAMVASH
ncbi:efflux RND transporter periplasmic adaptor subunit [Hydrogenophaga sp.]|uniref:efflux RND transporter periplasmic adaptor subunit n=1 Tax=Hydrogenophaga sp. TaxID=1904254 RepID=UPI00271B4E29|nr:efflux RND transporter periplasmic adaptor subunit [Hydrogenophaga sp.]MDO9434312.1 efflux RND transporter periplasmic adaptor subunit [Hydrogenophaga sp.]